MDGKWKKIDKKRKNGKSEKSGRKWNKIQSNQIRKRGKRRNCFKKMSRGTKRIGEEK